MSKFPGYNFYGGVTPSTYFDNGGNEYIGCCAELDRPDLPKEQRFFGFYVFARKIGGEWAPLTLQRFCTGHGMITPGGFWIAVTGSEWFKDRIPGWVPFPPPSGLSARYVQALEKLCSLLGL